MKETRFNLTAEVMNSEDDKSTKKSERPPGEEKKGSELTKKSSRTTSSAPTKQGQNEAGPSRTRGRKPDRSTDDKKELSPSSSLASIITKPSIKSIKSDTHRDVIDVENKPNTTEEDKQSGKPLFVDISGKSLTKKETLQILNKYSSIFVDNLKEPVPKDPLSYRRESDGVRSPLPGTSTRTPDLANKLSEIGSQHFRQTQNSSVYASSNPVQRPVSETHSTESVVERIHQYEDETLPVSQTSEGNSGQEKKSKSKSGKYGSPKLSLKNMSQKQGTSKQESSKKESSKRTSKQDPAKTDKQEGAGNQENPKPDSETKDPIFHAGHVAVSNLDAERLAMRLERLRKGRLEFRESTEFDSDLSNDDEDEGCLTPNSPAEQCIPRKCSAVRSLGRSTPCRLEERRRHRMKAPEWESFTSCPARISREVFPATQSSRKGRLSAERVKEETWDVANQRVRSPPSPTRESRGTKR